MGWGDCESNESEESLFILQSIDITIAMCDMHAHQAALREAQKHLKETFGFNVETVK